MLKKHVTHFLGVIMADHIEALEKQRAQESQERCLIRCGICNKLIVRANTDEWVYHDSFPRTGVACRHHHGVMEKYRELLKEANKKLEVE